jgi:hypothetical protein
MLLGSNEGEPSVRTGRGHVQRHAHVLQSPPRLRPPVLWGVLPFPPLDK